MYIEVAFPAWTCLQYGRNKKNIDSCRLNKSSKCYLQKLIRNGDKRAVVGCAHSRMLLWKSLYVSHFDVGALPLHQHELYWLRIGLSYIVLHNFRLRIFRFEVHDSYLPLVSVEWYGHVDT